MSNVGVGLVRDVGTLLLEAIEDVNFAEAAMEEDVEFGAGCVPEVGTPRFETIEAEDEADGGFFFVNDDDEPLA